MNQRWKEQQVSHPHAAAIIQLRREMQAHPDVVLLPSVKLSLAWHKRALAIAEQSRGLESNEVKGFKDLGKQMRDDGLTGPAIYFVSTLICPTLVPRC